MGRGYAKERKLGVTNKDWSLKLKKNSLSLSLSLSLIQMGSLGKISCKYGGVLFGSDVGCIFELYQSHGFDFLLFPLLLFLSFVC